MTASLKLLGIYGVLITLLNVCACSDKVAGAGSETTNGIVGCVINDDGSPALQTTVKLFPADFDPGSKTPIAKRFTTTTDTRGRFRFERLDKGTYAVLARNQDRSLYARISDIQIDTVDSMMQLDSCRLAAPGTVIVDFTNAAQNASGYCYLPGTDIYAPIDSNRLVRLSGVPAGVFTSVMHVSAAGLGSEVVRHAVAVQSGVSVDIKNPGWKYTRPISFNTTVSGADVAHDLFDVPVLLRLDNNNFNFTEAHASGADLIFTTDKNRAVPFEIERWDAAASVAEIWLHIDTLRGNSAGQTVAMYWGASTLAAATPEPGGIGVFDTAAGFQGVWHLDDAANDSARDATVNRYNGGSPDSARPAVVAGIIGDARRFNGTNSFITMPNTANSAISFPQNGRFTVSAWVYVDTPDKHAHVIVSKGNTQYFIWYSSIHLNATLWEFADYRNESGWDLATTPFTAGEWVYVVGVRDGTSHVLYINGERADTLIDYVMSLARSEQSDLMIGRFAQIMASPANDEGYCYFNGAIDEVQISSVPRSAEWIRLAYRNQCKNDKLVTFK